jgi:hypothetical protein
MMPRHVREAALIELMDDLKEELAKNPFLRRARSFAEVRSRALTASPEELGVKVGADDQILSAVIDLGYPEAIVSLVMTAGGGTDVGIGEGDSVLTATGLPGVREASQRFLLLAASHLQPVPDVGLRSPEIGKVIFHLRTVRHTSVLGASAGELMTDHDVLSPLFRAAQSILRAIRSQLQ